MGQTPAIHPKPQHGYEIPKFLGDHIFFERYQFTWFSRRMPKNKHVFINQFHRQEGQHAWQNTYAHGIKKKCLMMRPFAMAALPRCVIWPSPLSRNSNLGSLTISSHLCQETRENKMKITREEVVTPIPHNKQLLTPTWSRAKAVVCEVESERRHHTQYTYLVDRCIAVAQRPALSLAACARVMASRI